MPQIRAVMSGASLERPAAQQRLEEARRLVDPQLDAEHLVAADPHVHRALALDPGQGGGLDPAGAAVALAHRPCLRGASHRRPPGRRARWR